MSARFIIIGLKAVTFVTLSIIMVATVYGYRLDDSGAIGRTGIVDISFVPRDAELFVDSARIETASGKIVLPLAIGSHDVAVRKIGFQPVRKTIQVDGTTANRMGTVYLSPVAGELDWSGLSNAGANRATTTGPLCETETIFDVRGARVVKNGKVVTIDDKVVSREASSVLSATETILVGSEFSLLSVDPITGVIDTLHRFDARIADIVNGPSNENVFVSTNHDVALCSIPNALCMHVIHSPQRITAVEYGTTTRKLTIAADGNQRMEVAFNDWATGFWGL